MITIKVKFRAAFVEREGCIVMGHMILEKMAKLYFLTWVEFTL